MRQQGRGKGLLCIQRKGFVGLRLKRELFLPDGHLPADMMQKAKHS